MVDGRHRPGFTGRLANAFMGLSDPGPDWATRLSAASDNPMGLTFGGLEPPSHESRALFMRDIQQLRAMQSGPTPALTAIASVILFRWFFDVRPLAVALARKLGVQLWLPGESDRARRYHAAVIEDKPVLVVPGAAMQDGPFGSAWISLYSV